MDECVEHEQFVGFEATGDAHSEAGRWLEALHAGFCAVKESFSQEVTDALIGLSLRRCSLYPGEMMQMAVCLENGANVRQLLVLMDMGFLEAADPFLIVTREEAERQMADIGVFPQPGPEKAEEKPHRTEHRETGPEEGAERAGNNMAGWKTQAEVAAIRKRYPAGFRIELDYMNKQGMTPGLKGIVKSVDDAGQLHMIWENGRSLTLVPGADRFHRLPEPQTEKEAGKETEAEEMER